MKKKYGKERRAKSTKIKARLPKDQMLNPKDFNVRKKLFEKLNTSPIPTGELLDNISLFIDRRLLSQFLFMNEIYKRIINLHGVVMEFGVRYGPKTALLTSLRGIHEPFNHNRKIIGFDTFEGFIEGTEKDIPTIVKKHDLSVPSEYEAFLEEVLKIHESMSPISHIKKFELIKGNASVTVREYLDNHPETIISLAYFDMDLYEPTKECLQAILPHLTKGAVVGFDELNDPRWPGETIALKEVLTLGKFKIYHSKYKAQAAYLIYGE